MKRVITVIIISLFLFCNISYSQLGWFIQNSGTTTQFSSIKFFDGNTAWAVGWNPNIYKTTNGGTNWIAYNSGNNVSYQSVHFANSNTGWVVGGDGAIIKTTNGGLNWFNQYSGTGNLLMYVNFVGNQTGWAAGYGGVLLKTTNGGTNWVRKNTNVTYNILCVYFVNSTLGFFDGDNGTIKRSTNAGETWDSVSTPINYNLDKFFFINNNTGWVTGINGTVLKTTNTGLTWLYTYTGVSSWITAVHFFDINTGYACGGEYGNPTGGIILKSINGGISWTPTTHPVVPWMSFLNFVTPDTGWAVGQNGLIMKTVDGGYPPPATPVQISPLNNAVLNSITPFLYWSQPAYATSYSYLVLSGSSVVDSGTICADYYIVPTGELQYNSLYHWRVKANNSAGSSFWSPDWYFNTGVNGINVVSSGIPDSYNLYQNYPNPFNPSTTIKFDVPKSSNVKMTVYDINGRVVENLFNGNIQPGKFEFKWNAAKYSSGFYFVKMESKDFSGIKKMMLIK
ncbi:MAG: YCF48-related protein [Ignavibacteria bacterium]|nr:YCF48-related protein [Ignavibacteria bacterium]